MRYELKPMINNKKPDGVIYHEHGRVYIEAVCAQGPDEFRDKRGEAELCRMISPRLIEQGLLVWLSYETIKKDEWDVDQVHRATELKEPPSKADADSVFKQVQEMTSEPPDQYGDWSGEIEIRKRKVSAHVSRRHLNKPRSAHIGHTACAVGFTKDPSKGGDIGDRYKADRDRITRKIRRYKPATLDGWPLIVALYSQDAWDHELAAAVVYGTTYPALTMARDADNGKTVAIDAREILMPDGIWSDERGNHRRHLAAIWIFCSWDTANELPLLAANPFLEDEDIDHAIPKRMRDVSMIPSSVAQRPRAVGC